MNDFLNSLSNLAAGFGRGVQAVGTLGLSELDRLDIANRKKEQQDRLAQLANLATGQNIPQSAILDLPPEVIAQNQQRALMATSPQYLSSILEGLTPQGQLEQQKARGAMDVQRLQGLNYQSEIGSRNQEMGFKQQEQARLIQQERARQAQAAQLINAFQASGQAMPDLTALGAGFAASGNKDLADVVNNIQKIRTEAGNQTFDQSTKLRKEYLNNADTFIKQRDAYGRIQASTADPSAAGDLATIFNFMKLLDPGSTVREGEFATAERAGSVPDRILAQYNKVLRGERLAPEQRADFVTRSQKLYEQSSGQHQKLVKQYSGLAQRVGVPVDQVIIDLGLEEQAPPQNTQIQAPREGSNTLQEYDFDPSSGAFISKKKDSGVGMNSPQTNQDAIRGNSGEDFIGDAIQGIKDYRAYNRDVLSKQAPTNNNPIQELISNVRQFQERNDFKEPPMRSGTSVKVNPQNKNLVKQFEGFSPVAYNDVAGIPTTGYGHRITGQETTNDPEQLFQQDIGIAKNAVNNLVKVPLSRQQQEALTSFVYNVGQGAFAKSTLLKKLNSGDVDGAAAEFDRWINAGGKPIKGLVNRRNKEKALFTGNV